MSNMGEEILLPIRLAKGQLVPPRDTFFCMKFWIPCERLFKSRNVERHIAASRKVGADRPDRRYVA
jgi:hypothetical protein